VPLFLACDWSVEPPLGAYGACKIPVTATYTSHPLLVTYCGCATPMDASSCVERLTVIHATDAHRCDGANTSTLQCSERLRHQDRQDRLQCRRRAVRSDRSAHCLLRSPPVVGLPKCSAYPAFPAVPIPSRSSSGERGSCRAHGFVLWEPPFSAPSSFGIPNFQTIKYNCGDHNGGFIENTLCHHLLGMERGRSTHKMAHHLKTGQKRLA